MLCGGSLRWCLLLGQLDAPRNQCEDAHHICGQDWLDRHARDVNAGRTNAAMVFYERCGSLLGICRDWTVEQCRDSASSLFYHAVTRNVRKIAAGICFKQAPRGSAIGAR